LTYRKDFRTLSQFKRDIKNGSIQQKKILQSFLKTISPNKTLKVWNRGCDNSGKYIPLSEVSTYPDYEIENLGLVEIQYSSTFCRNFFHIKTKKILLVIALNSIILMVNGWNDESKYILIDKKMAKVIKARCRLVSWRGGGFKKAFKIPVAWFKWQELEQCG